MHNHRDRDPRHDWCDVLRIRMVIVLASAFAFVVLFASPVNAVSATSMEPSPISTQYPPCWCVWLAAVAWASLWSIRNGRDSSWTANQRSSVMFPNTRALIVDHRLPDRLQLRNQLESLQIEVSEEGNGSRATDRALNERFDIIFMSPHLPIMKARVVRDVLRRSGVTTPIVMTCATPDEQQEQEQHEQDQRANSRVFTITQPIRLSELRVLLLDVDGRQAVSEPVDGALGDLAAMDQALESQDYDQLIALAQKLRDFGGDLGSEGLASSAERLEACLLEEDLEDVQVAEIKAAIAELSDLAVKQDRDGTEVRAVSKQVPR